MAVRPAPPQVRPGTAGKTQAPAKQLPNAGQSVSPQKGKAIFFEIGRKVVPLSELPGRGSVHADREGGRADSYHHAEDIFDFAELDLATVGNETINGIRVVRFVDNVLAALGIRTTFMPETRIPDDNDPRSEVAVRHARAGREGGEQHIFGPLGLGIVFGASVPMPLVRWPITHFFATIMRSEVYTMAALQNTLSVWVGLFLPQNDSAE